jgi:hypothetical protein
MRYFVFLFCAVTLLLTASTQLSHAQAKVDKEGVDSADNTPNNHVTVEEPSDKIELAVKSGDGTSTNAVAYFQDFEANNGGFVTSGTTTSWAYGTPTSGPGAANSGTKVWATNLTGNYGNNEDGYIDSPNIDLSSYMGSKVTLSWYQYLVTESGYDFASVEVSKDGGANWTVVYGEISGSVDPTWNQRIVELDSSYAVSNFRVSFRLRSDSSIVRSGFYIDDIRVNVSANCGADGTYSCTASTQTGGPTYDFETFSGSPLIGADDAVYPVPVGFDFQFYGTSYSNAYVSTNGFLSFMSGQGSGCCSGQNLPTSTTPNGVVAAWWEDLNSAAGGTMKYATLGTAPNRRFVVEFNAVPHYASGNLVSFQIKLFEGSNIIEVHYQAAPSDGGTHVAGIENQAGTSAVVFQYGTSGLSTPVAVRYKPICQGTDALSLYSCSGVPYSADSPTWTSLTLADDAVSAPIALPFTFDFYTAGYTNIYVCSNGAINFSGDYCGTTPSAIPTSSTPNTFVAGWWADLDPSAGGTIRYGTTGTAPNRRFVVEFNGVPHYSGGNLVTMQFKLYETSNLVEVHYGSAATNGTTHVAGIESQGGALGIQYFNGTNSISGNLHAPVAVRYTPPTVVPASIAQFSSTYLANGRVVVAWQSAAETGTVGYNLRTADRGGWTSLNDALIVSNNSSASNPTRYETTVRADSTETVYLEEIDLRGRTRLHGPFVLGEIYGKDIEPQLIDWHMIGAEHAALASERDQLALDTVRQTFISQTVSNAAGGIDVLVEQDGVYRITYQDIVDFGINPDGLPTRRIALVNQGQAVPVRILGGPVVGPNTIIEFVGEAVDSLYTRTNVYSLTVNPTLAERTARDTAPIPAGDPVGYYLETVSVENDNDYLFLTPTDDPWADTRLMAYGNSFTHEVMVTVDQLVDGAAPATLLIDAWGLTDWPVADDHRLQVALNGTPLADVTYDGLTAQRVAVDLPPGLLMEGANVVSLTVPQPTDPVVRWDIQYLDAVSITYPRAFVARDNGLMFTAAGDVFAVSGLTGDGGSLYRVSFDGTPTRIERAEFISNGNGAFTVRFRGAAEVATYILVTTDAMPQVELTPRRPVTDITSGSADYIMIAHPSFIDGLAPLVAHHQANGLSVKVVDVDDVYAQFSGGVYDPDAIRAYVAHAVTNMGTQFVLLVGGDTYDYFDNLGLGSISFIPSLYGPTEPYVNFAPLDPLFADVDNNAVPDVAIGRFPVRTVAELNTIIAKTLMYADKDYGQSLVIAADKADGGISFSEGSDAFVTQLPADWSVATAYIDDLGVADARTTLLDGMNSGVALTSFMGHSGPYSWTFSTPPFFLADDAAALSNSARPTVVTQWGCWNTYHVDPYYDTLAHEFMLHSDGGAAAVLGATTITQSSSEEALGLRVMPRIVASGVTIGQGIQDAKTDLALTNSALRDVLLGWTLLGDPAMMIAP